MNFPKFYFSRGFFSLFLIQVHTSHTAAWEKILFHSNKKKKFTCESVEILNFIVCGRVKTLQHTNHIF